MRATDFLLRSTIACVASWWLMLSVCFAWAPSTKLKRELCALSTTMTSSFSW
jgi:hypothetical protein